MLKINQGLWPNLFILLHAMTLGTISLSASNDSPTTQDMTATFQLIENKNDQTFLAKLTLKNLSKEEKKDWTLHFNFVRPILEVKGASLLKDTTRNGDFYSLRATDEAAPLKPDSEVSVELKGKWFLKHETDAPSGFFLSYRDSKGKTQLQEIPVVAKLTQSPRTGKAAELRRLIPEPVTFEARAGAPFLIREHSPLIVTEGAVGALEAANFLSAELSGPLGFRLPIKTQRNGSQEENAIIFKPAPKNFSRNAEAYELTVSSQQIRILASSAAGFHYAVQSLRQLLPAAVYQQTNTADSAWGLTPVHVVDEPRFAYRGLHLDVARNFHSPAEVKRLLDLMAVHKLNRFHWHLTDDEGWRIQIRAYPQLTEIGAYRGYGLPLAPSLGSGPARSGGFYSQREIAEVIQYAAARQIQIIPEIDIPGHARALIKSLPELLQDPHDQSVYESVQGYHDNVLSPCLASTYEVLDTVLSEVSALFPSPIIHIGSDEVPEGVWDPKRSPNCQKLMVQEKLKDRHEVQNHFIKKIKALVEKHGKQIAGWEEITSGGGIADRKVLAFAWKSQASGEQLAKQGYPVIMNPADHLYFDLAYTDDPKEPGYYWAGTIDTPKVYAFEPVPAGLTQKEKTRILGVQANLWSETLRDRRDIDYRAFPRLAALAEIAWTPGSRRDWSRFYGTLVSDHLPRLENYGVQYRIATGLSKEPNSH